MIYFTNVQLDGTNSQLHAPRGFSTQSRVKCFGRAFAPLREPHIVLWCRSIELSYNSDLPFVLVNSAPACRKQIHWFPLLTTIRRCHACCLARSRRRD